MSLTALLLMAACKGRVSLADADTALAFDGAGCVDVPIEPAARGSTFTVELWLRGAADAEFGIMPLMVWPGAFALAETEDERTWFGDSALLTGVGYPTGFMDGQVHHLAGTIDEESDFTLWFDGVRAGNGEVSPETAGSGLVIGCWREKDVWFEGVIDEVRLSSVVRYDEDFTPVEAPFNLDEGTLSLWHLDEAEGDVTLDAAARYDGALTGVEWVESFMGGAATDSGT